MDHLEPPRNVNPSNAVFGSWSMAVWPVGRLDAFDDTEMGKNVQTTIWTLGRMQFRRFWTYLVNKTAVGPRCK